MKLSFLKKGTEGKKFDLAGSFRTRSFRVGGYSVAAAVIVLAIAVAVNIFMNALPASKTQFDTTSNQLFTISEQTESLVAGLDSDVTVYWIVQSGYEDTTIEMLLARYEAMSDKINVVKKDPDVYPTFIQQYVTEGVYNNSLIVVSGERYRYVSYEEIYLYDYSNYYYYGTYDVSFDGESALTSAIDYVISKDLPKVYILSGHGELDIPSSFTTALEKENVETESLYLLTLETVPEDADSVLIYAPQSDISEEEKDKLQSYLQTGGDMLLITEPLENTVLTNLEALMSDYGVTAAEGIVVEGNQNYYAWGTPYYLLPEFGSHAIVSPLRESGYYVLLPIAQGLSVSADIRDTVSVTKLLTTSDAAFSKIAGYALTTYEKEAGDIDGPFALAVAITETIDEENETNIVWVSSSALLDESANMQVSGGNQDLFLNAVNWMCDQEESSISIHAKSMSYEYLTISSGTVSLLSVLIVGVIPLCYLGYGLHIWIRRKRR